MSRRCILKKSLGAYRDELVIFDFFLEKDTNNVIFNEINTLPGFTSISMYPMLWKAQGIDIEELVQRQIDLAFERRY